jgi:hypothetical protein
MSLPQKLSENNLMMNELALLNLTDIVIKIKKKKWDLDN